MSEHSNGNSNSNDNCDETKQDNDFVDNKTELINSNKTDNNKYLVEAKSDMANTNQFKHVDLREVEYIDNFKNNTKTSSCQKLRIFL